MKIQVSEASGEVLNWLVARCEGHEFSVEDWKTLMSKADWPHCYELDWSQGGPIIEREGIRLEFLGKKYGWSARWPSWTFIGDAQTIPTGGGPTLLTAGLRCFIEARLGYEVEVPDALLV